MCTFSKTTFFPILLIHNKINLVTICDNLSHEESLIYLILLIINLFIECLITEKLKHEYNEKFTSKCQNNIIIPYNPKLEIQIPHKLQNHNLKYLGLNDTL